MISESPLWSNKSDSVSHYLLTVGVYCRVTLGGDSLSVSTHYGVTIEVDLLTLSIDHHAICDRPRCCDNNGDS